MDPISKIKVGNSSYDIKDQTARLAIVTLNDNKLDSDGVANKTASIPFGEVDSTSTATAFTATVDGITELRDGVCMLLKNGVVTSASGFTININNLGAKPCYNNMTTGNDITPTNPTRDTTIFNINYTMLFVYSSTIVDGGGWICYRGYDANTNTIGYQLRTNSTVMTVTDTARYYKLYFTSANGKQWVPASVNSTNNATAARPVNQRPINPFGRIVYTSANTNYAAGANLAATSIWDQYPLVLGYSFNRTGAALTLTAKTPVYVKCAPQADGSAIIDATTPYVQALPSTEDGKIYIYLGVAYDATHIELTHNHPVYYYKDGAIREWTNAESGDTNIIETVKVNGTALTPDTNKAVNVIVPTKTSDLTNDSGFITSGGDCKFFDLSDSINFYSIADVKDLVTGTLPANTYSTIANLLTSKYVVIKITNNTGEISELSYYLTTGDGSFDFASTTLRFNITIRIYDNDTWKLYYKRTENTIETIKVNGTALTPDSNKAVDISVPYTMYVTVTENNGTYTADKTYTEIKSALTNNTEVIVLYGNRRFYFKLILILLGFEFIVFTNYNSYSSSEDVNITLPFVETLIFTSNNILYVKTSDQIATTEFVQQELLNGGYQEITYAELKALRDNSQLVPGKYYRITDYVATVDSYAEPNARSANHQFDIIVTADSVNKLNEQAHAIQHIGDTYFSNSNLEAWELRYQLDNVKWSKKARTYLSDEDNNYTFFAIGTIELGGHTYQLLQGFGLYVDDWSDYALVNSLEEGETIYCYYGDPEDFDPESPEKVGTVSSVDTVTNDGKGTILLMKDEYGNECPYDFKNIQFKRWKATDTISGRNGLGGKYMVADLRVRPQELSVDDTEDFIWAYTFSSSNDGGDQTDFSLGGQDVYYNVLKPYRDLLPNNVMFGDGNYNNSFGFNCHNNSLGKYCTYNSFSDNCSYNSWGNDCYSNSCGNGYMSNSWGNFCDNNSWGKNCTYNSLGDQCSYNSWGDQCSYNSCGKNNHYNSCGNNCNDNSWGNEVMQSTLFDGVQYTQITTNTVKNVQVLNGVMGAHSNKLTLTFAANKEYTQVACLTSAGALKIYVPGDLA